MMIFRYGLAWFFFIILITLQWPLWFAKGSTVAVWENEEQRNILQKNNHQLSIRNQALSAEIQDLKHGHDAIEERARYQLGMIKPKEKFYQVTP
jgi:cell division protein FtsB